LLQIKELAMQFYGPKCPVVQKITRQTHRQQGNVIYSALERRRVVQEYLNAVAVRKMR
jgi:hypothetical protein